MKIYNIQGPHKAPILRRTLHKLHELHKLHLHVQTIEDVKFKVQIKYACTVLYNVPYIVEEPDLK